MTPVSNPSVGAKTARSNSSANSDLKNMFTKESWNTTARGRSGRSRPQTIGSISRGSCSAGSRPTATSGNSRVVGPDSRSQTTGSGIRSARPIIRARSPWTVAGTSTNRSRGGSGWRGPPWPSARFSSRQASRVPSAFQCVSVR
jgi:hypothetical protein